MSKTTEADDRGIKFTQYTQLESLQEYALVSQTELRVEKFSRESDGSWTWRAFSGLEAQVPFESVGSTIPLSEVFAGVEF